MKDLRKQVLDKNPDEFHFHMINSEVKDGRHFEKKNPHDEHSEEQMKLLQSQDYKYISYKRTMELAKIERLKSSLHLIDCPEKPKKKHIIFVDELEDLDKFDWKSRAEPPFQSIEEGDVKGRQKAYRELKRREERARQLTIILEKMKLKIQMNVSIMISDLCSLFRWNFHLTNSFKPCLWTENERE